MKGPGIGYGTVAKRLGVSEREVYYWLQKDRAKPQRSLQKTAKMKIGSSLKRKPLQNFAKPSEPVPQGDRDQFHRGDPSSFCRRPGCHRRADEKKHHAVYRQHIRDLDGDQWDQDDALSVCRRCHAEHHGRGPGTLPVSCLRDENIAFAVRLMGGSRTHAYFSRYYRGNDDRLQALLVGDC